MNNDSIQELLAAIEEETVWDYHRIFDEVRHNLANESDIQMLITIGSRIIYANKKLCDLLNYSCDDLMFTDVMELIPPEDLGIVYGWMERLREKKSVNYMLRGITGDNNYIWVKASSIYFSKYKLSLSFLNKVGTIPANYSQIN